MRFVFWPFIKIIKMVQDLILFQQSKSRKDLNSLTCEVYRYTHVDKKNNDVGGNRKKIYYTKKISKEGEGEEEGKLNKR